MSGICSAHQGECPDDCAINARYMQIQLSRISGALVDAANVVVYEGDYARSIRELVAERDKLQALLKA